MKQEVIQGFLNVPGIAGIALINGLSRPCFYGFTTRFDLTQQDSIAQSIQQVLETTPEGFNAFEFQFDQYRLYLHKLNQGMTLLVLTQNHLSRRGYTQEVRRLLLELQLDQSNPIAEFQAIIAKLPLLFQTPLPSPLPLSSPAPPALKPIESRGSLSDPPLFVHRNGSSAPIELNPTTNRNAGWVERESELPSLDQSGMESGAQPLRDQSRPDQSRLDQSGPDQSGPDQSRPDQVMLPSDQLFLQSSASEQPASEQPASEQPSPAPPLPSQPRVSEPTVAVQEVLAAMNRLSQLATQYLGTLVVTNYWKATRPPNEWLLHFQIERSAQLTFVVQAPSQRLPLLTPEQHRSLQVWVVAFIQRCTQVMRGFVKIVQHALTDRQKALLLPPPTEVSG
jgi:hypothetical protein